MVDTYRLRTPRLHTSDTCSLLLVLLLPVGRWFGASWRACMRWRFVGRSACRSVGRVAAAGRCCSVVRRRRPARRQRLTPVTTPGRLRHIRRTERRSREGQDEIGRMEVEEEMSYIRRVLLVGRTMGLLVRRCAACTDECGHLLRCLNMMGMMDAICGGGAAPPHRGGRGGGEQDAVHAHHRVSADPRQPQLRGPRGAAAVLHGRVSLSFN